MSTTPETIAEAKQRYIEDEDDDYWELPFEADVERLIDESGYPETPWDEAVITDLDALEGEAPEEEDEQQGYDVPETDNTADEPQEPEPVPNNSIDLQHVGGVDITHHNPDSVQTIGGMTTDITYGGHICLEPDHPLVDPLEESFRQAIPLTIHCDNRRYEDALVTKLTDQHVDDEPSTLRVGFQAAKMTVEGGRCGLTAHDIITEETIDQLVQQTIENWYEANLGREIGTIDRNELLCQIKHSLNCLEGAYNVTIREEANDIRFTRIEVDIPILDYQKQFHAPENDPAFDFERR